MVNVVFAKASGAAERSRSFEIYSVCVPEVTRMAAVAGGDWSGRCGVLRHERDARAIFFSLVKNNRLIPTHKHPLFHHKLQRLREHDLFDILAGLGHVAGTVGVADGNDVLGDDGSFVEALVDGVGGGADDLHAALIGAFVRLRADEGREE